MNNIYSTQGINIFPTNKTKADSVIIKKQAHADTSKIISTDTSKNISVVRILPLRQKHFLDSTFSNNILEKSEIDKNDYRYTGNFFSLVPFGFVRDLGSIGQPNEILIYGQGFGRSSYLSDGIDFTNRLTNSFDLNLIQSENVSRVEIIPLARGFLYSSNNNPVSVNFIPDNFQRTKPYTRIRIYQAAYQEGLIDGIFNASLSKKLSLFAEVTNQSTSRNYANTDYSSWLASVRFRYLYSDKINLTAGYTYGNTKTQLFGGVDYDSIKNSYSASQINNIMYSKIQAFVNYTDRYQKVTFNNFSIKTLAELIPGSVSELTLFYQGNLSEYRQNDTTYRYNLQPGVPSIIDNNKYKTLGIHFEQPLNYSIATLSITADINKNTLTSPLIFNEKKYTAASIAAIANFNLFENGLIPSAFVKHLSYDGKTYNGFGADASMTLFNNTRLYSGYSEFQKPYDVFAENISNSIPKTKSFEISINYRDKQTNIKAGYFNIASTNSAVPVSVTNISGNNIKNQYTHYFKVDEVLLKGLNINLDYRIWKLLFSTNSSFYFSETDRNKLGIPQFTSSGGIFYIDTLFNSNLKLKTGITYSSVGNRNGLQPDFEKNISSAYTQIIAPTIRSIPYLPASTYFANYQINLFLAGKIQENATIYFIYENLLGSQYFIVPYYPMYEGGMRFGVSWEFFD